MNPEDPSTPSRPTGVNRRQALALTAMAAATPTLAQEPAASPSPYRIHKGRIRQSVMGWCFNPMPVPELAKACVDIGIEGIEGIGRESYPTVLEMGLKIALVGSHGFATGPVNPANHDECIHVSHL